MKADTFWGPGVRGCRGTLHQIFLSLPKVLKNFVVRAVFLLCMLRSGVRTVLIIDHRKALAVSCNTCISIPNLQSVWRIKPGACLLMLCRFPPTSLPTHCGSALQQCEARAPRPQPSHDRTLLLQVIVEKVSGSQIVDIDKRKYLVPSDITVAQFMWIIRKRIQLPSEKAIFLFVDKTVPQSR